MSGAEPVIAAPHEPHNVAPSRTSPPHFGQSISQDPHGIGAAASTVWVTIRGCKEAPEPEHIPGPHWSNSAAAATLYAMSTAIRALLLSLAVIAFAFIVGGGSVVSTASCSVDTCCHAGPASTRRDAVVAVAQVTDRLAYVSGGHRASYGGVMRSCVSERTSVVRLRNPSANLRI